MLADVGKIEKPLLIMHGEQDPQVPPQESQEFVAALKSAGKIYEYVTYPNEGHGFRQTRPSPEFVSSATNFPSEVSSLRRVVNRQGTAPQCDYSLITVLSGAEKLGAEGTLAGLDL